MELTITSGPEAGRTVQVAGDRVTVGRQAGNDLMLLDPKTSRQHAYFQALPDGQLALYDLGSSNGTFVNGHQVQSATLSGGEEVRFGEKRVVMARGRHSIMAAVVTGKRLNGLPVRLQRAVGQFEQSHGEALSRWNGNLAGLDSADTALRSVLTARYRGPVPT